MPVRTRFAPSPTGQLHLGHALAAHVAHSFAREAGGEFLLRHEDLDTGRVREEFYQNIEQDLTWLGLIWDGPALRQTHRTAAYTAALDSLQRRNLVYPCFCTRREIQQEWAQIAAAPHGPEAPIYPGTCRRLTAIQLQEKHLTATPYAWRLDSALASTLTGPLTFRDLRLGDFAVDPQLLGDVVLARKDIATAYHLAVVVDDAFQEITHVTRGEDLLAATHVHRLLQVLLDFPTPLYLHHPLLRDATGKRLAKRDDALSLATLRLSGLSPTAVLANLHPSKINNHHSPFIHQIALIQQPSVSD